jgi:rhamnose utilization protein RhaD (predicted bifunctional aldolase and dehydrogenase)
MSDNTEQAPVEQTQQPVAEQSIDYSAQVELLKAKNQELIAEKQKVKGKFDDLQEQLSALQTERAEQKQQKLQEQGQYQDLWKEANDANAGLKSQIAEMQAALEAKEQQFTQQQIKSTALNHFAQAGVINPDHMYNLVRENLRIEDGNLVAVDGGVQQTLGEYVERLKQPESGADYMFRGNGAVGMGSSGSAALSGGGTNPYISGNFTEIVKLETENPDLAKRMKAQAKQ